MNKPRHSRHTCKGHAHSTDPYGPTTAVARRDAGASPRRQDQHHNKRHASRLQLYTDKQLPSGAAISR